jgi:hypothetical protein
MSDSAEKSKVSLHEVKVWLTLRGKPDQWLANDDIAKESEVKVRTARQYTARQGGCLNVPKRFPRIASDWRARRSYQANSKGLML